MTVVFYPISTTMGIETSINILLIHLRWHVEEKADGSQDSGIPAKPLL